jgi:hypothetical protein
VRAPAFAALLLLAACRSPEGERPPPAPDPAAGPPPAEDTSELVQVELWLAGESELAVHFMIAPGWHLYLQNPGDAGLRTDATFTGPPGVGFGPLRYPAPERFSSPGGITSYGYEHETALFADVLLPDPPPERGDVTVEATWLACIRGKGQARADLAAGRIADETRLVDHRQRLPRPGSEFPAEIRWSGDGEHRSLEVVLREGEVVDFFPLLTDPAQLQETTREPRRLVLSYRGAPAAPGPQGVVGVAAPEGGRRYFHLEAPWPST